MELKSSRKEIAELKFRLWRVENKAASVEAHYNIIMADIVNLRSINMMLQKIVKSKDRWIEEKIEENFRSKQELVKANQIKERTFIQWDSPSMGFAKMIEQLKYLKGRNDYLSQLVHKSDGE